MTKLPSLKAVQTFEVVARHLSFSRAAEELHVTQSAISHQIRSLETFLGKQLFNRQSHKVHLTQEGDMYFKAVKNMFHNLTDATRNVIGEHKVTLRIVAQTSIALEWLAVKMHLFSAKHPDIEIWLSLAASASDHNPQEFDISLGTWPAPLNFETRRLRDECWYPVVSTEFYANHALESATDILNYLLISSENGQDWQLWMQTQHLNIKQKLDIQHVSHTILATKVALGGEGVALSCDFICHEMLANNRLVAIKDWSYELPWGHYHVHYKPSGIKKESSEKFVDWVLTEAKLGR